MLLVINVAYIRKGIGMTINEILRNAIQPNITFGEQSVFNTDGYWYHNDYVSDWFHQWHLLFDHFSE